MILSGTGILTKPLNIVYAHEKSILPIHKKNEDKK